MPILMTKDTKSVLGEGAGKCESRSLLQNKFVFFDDKVSEYKRISVDLFLDNGIADLNALVAEKNKEAGRAKTEDKRKKAQEWLKIVTPLTSGRQPIKTFPRDFSWLDNISSNRRFSFKMETAGRLIVGQANGVLENCGLTIDRNSGLPFIPGSALKGVARDAAREIPELQDYIEQLFGTEDEKQKNKRCGVITFLDAYPVKSQALISMDVATPHYKEYYTKSGKNPNALDDENPIPLAFPVVNKNVPFNFNLLLMNKLIDDNQASFLLGLAGKCLKFALAELGVGAKTAAGYGWFKEEGHSKVTSNPSGKTISQSESLIQKWKGKLSSTSNFMVFVKDINTVANPEDKKTIFMAVMPEDKLRRLRKSDSYWQSFSSNSERKALLSSLGIELK